MDAARQAINDAFRDPNTAAPGTWQPAAGGDPVEVRLIALPPHDGLQGYGAGQFGTGSGGGHRFRVQAALVTPGKGDRFDTGGVTYEVTAPPRAGDRHRLTWDVDARVAP